LQFDSKFSKFAIYKISPLNEMPECPKKEKILQPNK